MFRLIVLLLLTLPALAQDEPWFPVQPDVVERVHEGREPAIGEPLPHAEESWRSPDLVLTDAPQFVVSMLPEVLELVHADNVVETAKLYGFEVRFIATPHAEPGFDALTREMRIQVDVQPVGRTSGFLGWSESSGTMYLNLERIRANVERHAEVRERLGLSVQEAFRIALTNTVKHELIVHYSGFAVSTRLTVFKDIYGGYTVPGYLDSALPQDLMNLQLRDLNPDHPFLQSAYWKELRARQGRSDRYER